MLVLLGVLSNLGGFLHLPDRYGLPHCRARIHRAECRVRGPSAGVIGFGSWVAARNLGRWKIGRLNGRYLCGEECIALNILNGITRRQNGFTYAEARIRLSKSGTQAEGGPSEASRNCWNSGSCRSRARFPWAGNAVTQLEWVRPPFAQRPHWRAWMPVTVNGYAGDVVHRSQHSSCLEFHRHWHGSLQE